MALSCSAIVKYSTVLSIGPIKLNYPFVLAPLAGVSDLPYRLVCRLMGCEFAFIEMISVHAITHRNTKTLELLTSHPDDRPLGIQFLGREPDDLRRALDMVADSGYSIIDLNAACPVKKVARRNEGAALMRDGAALSLAIKTLVEHASVPVTVKIRAGWDASSVNAAEIAKRAEDAGASAIFIHGRTRTQQYRGSAEHGPIRAAKEAVKIPVIGSGDIFSALAARKMMDETGCDGVVMARGSMGNPWIFRESIEYFRTGTIPPRPGIDEIASTMRRHLALCRKVYGDTRAPLIYRKLFIWYTKGLRDVKPLRQRAIHAKSVEEMEDAIAEMVRSNTEEHQPPNTATNFS